MSIELATLFGLAALIVAGVGLAVGVGWNPFVGKEDDQVFRGDEKPERKKWGDVLFEFALALRLCPAVVGKLLASFVRRPKKD